MVLWQTTVYKIIYIYNIRNESADHQTQMRLMYLYIYLFKLISIHPIEVHTMGMERVTFIIYVLRHLQSDTTNSRLERVHKNHSYNLHNLTLHFMINLHHVQITYCNYDCFHIFCKDLWKVNKYNTIQYIRRIIFASFVDDELQYTYCA